MINKYCIEHRVDGKVYCHNIDAISFIDAEQKALSKGWDIAYDRECWIGLLSMEIPTKEDGITPDWDNAVDYDKIKKG